MARVVSNLGTSVMLLAASLIVGCAVGEPHVLPPEVEPTVVRIIRFGVAKGSEESWVTACRRLAAVALEARVEANWLIHRIDDANYYLVTFGSREDFQDPHSIVHGFARHDTDELSEEFARLRAVKYTVTADEVWEQVPAWGTTSEMNSLTHPGVDHRSYRVASRHRAAVDSVLTDMANLLAREHYPYPMEGFRVGDGPEVVVHVLSFFGERTEYYARGQPEAFLAARGKGPQWLGLLDRLNVITHEQSRTESRYLHELSHDPWLLEQPPTTGQ